MQEYSNPEFDFDSEELIDVIDELPLWSAPFGLRLLEHIPYKKNITALDIGFGAGFPLTEIAMRLGLSSKVYGLDPWEIAIKRTEKKIACYGIQNVEILRGVAENIPLQNESVDLIVSNNGMNNVSDLQKSVSECARILKPGGQFIQTMNLEGTMAEFYSIMKDVLQEDSLEECIGEMQRHIYKRRKPLDEYIALLEKHGLAVKQLINDKFYYRFTNGTTMLNHYLIRSAFLTSWKEILPAERRDELFGIIEAKLNEKAKAEGTLKLIIPFAVIDCVKN